MDSNKCKYGKWLNRDSNMKSKMPSENAIFGHENQPITVAEKSLIDLEYRIQSLPFSSQALSNVVYDDAENSLTHLMLLFLLFNSEYVAIPG
jgi:hypothetical protein